jgi:hypothetical protein
VPPQVERLLSNCHASIGSLDNALSLWELRESAAGGGGSMWADEE